MTLCIDCPNVGEVEGITKREKCCLGAGFDREASWEQFEAEVRMKAPAPDQPRLNRQQRRAAGRKGGSS